jgi:nitrile hydratase
MSLAEGAAVRVIYAWPEAEGPVHIRTPHYVRGRSGRIVRALGSFPNPEDIAFARPAPLKALYHVAFPFRELWPEAAEDDSELLVELYEHWLEPVEQDR